MNEWGVPDWRDATNYGDTKSWDSDRWRWEFVRRRADVREAFDETCEETYSQDILWDELDDGGEPLKPIEPGFTSGCELALELGYHGLPNPRIGDQPDFALWCRNRDGSIWLSFKDAHKDPSLKQLTFRLDLPIEAQLESAKKELSRAQMERHGRKLQRRRHPAKWQTYLRVLDAREAGASWATVFEEIPELNSIEGVRKAYAAAQTMCSNF